MIFIMILMMILIQIFDDFMMIYIMILIMILMMILMMIFITIFKRPVNHYCGKALVVSSVPLPNWSDFCCQHLLSTSTSLQPPSLYPFPLLGWRSKKFHFNLIQPLPINNKSQPGTLIMSSCLDTNNVGYLCRSQTNNTVWERRNELAFKNWPGSTGRIALLSRSAPTEMCNGCMRYLFYHNLVVW